MSHQASRKHRVDKLLSWVGEACDTGTALKKEELIAKACLHFGAGERYVKEILKHLEFAKLIVVELGDVFTKAHYETLRLHEQGGIDQNKLIERLDNGLSK